MTWHKRLINLLRGNTLSRDIDREMDFHVRERADELVATGMSPREAQWEARRRFGNYGVQKERTRDADIFTWLDSFVGDLRYACRALRTSPAFTLVAILSLGLGIGANTAIFSLINAVMLKSLPVNHPEALVAVTMGTDHSAEFTNPIWEQVRDRQSVFAVAAAYGNTRFDLTAGGEMRLATGAWVSGDYFTMLGVRPELGRLIQRADDVRGCPGVAVLGSGFWKSEYASDATIVGKQIMLDAHPFQVIGVADAAFFGTEVGRTVQVYIPLCGEAIIRGAASGLDRRSQWWLNVIGRPKPDIDPVRLQSDLGSIAAAVFASTVPQNWGVKNQQDYLKTTLSVVPARTGFSRVRNQYGAALYVLMAVVAIVLLVACANVANLLLARAAAREREIAIRFAIGAGRGRMIRQLLTESVLLSLLGAGVGAVFARWGSHVLLGFLINPRNAVTLDLSVDLRVLAFTVGVGMATGVLFGLAPAWRSSRVNPQAAMKAGGRGVMEGHSRFGIGKALVVAQIALSLVLVAASGLLLGSFRKLMTIDAGFNPHGVLFVSVDSRNATNPAARLHTVYDGLLRRAAALPGVRAVSLASFTPVSGNSWNDNIYVDGFTPKDADDNLVYFNQVGGTYFTALGTPVLAGRPFAADDTPTSGRKAIVNEALAKKFFAGAPIGKRFRIKQGDSFQPWVEIIGTVKDAKYRELREDATPTAYYATSQDTAYTTFTNFVLRGDGSSRSIFQGFKDIVAEVDPRIALRFSSFEEQLATSLTRERLLAALSGFFGGLALILATIGLYGIMSYNVARRRNEIGIRIALGAARSRVVRMVLGEVGRMVTIGVVLGGLAAMASLRLMKAMLYGLSAHDPTTLAVSGIVLLAVAVLAGALPAWRASRLDPIAALREE